MPGTARVYLIPGFFGFATIGEMRYFAHVHRALGAALQRRGAAAVLHDVPTLPTASLQSRARRLAEVVSRTAEPEDTVHLIGHSTGGLDARWMLGPEGALRPAQRQQVRSVLSVVTPHHGAPLAAYLDTAQGEHWLRLISILTLHAIRHDRLAIGPAQRLMGAAVRLGAMAKLPPGLLDQVWQDVLRDFAPGRQTELRAFFQEVWADRSLLAQLTPDGLRQLAPGLQDRPEVRYGSIVACAAPPVRVPRLPSEGLYKMLHRLARWQASPVPRTPPPLRTALGPLSGEDNDAIVPTISQAHGELVFATRADHLDVLGFFHGPELAPPHLDWFRTHSGFGRERFSALWEAAADFLLQSA